MALLELTLARQERKPWGFRLQGGVDFEKALVVQSVVDGSPSQAAGLQVGLLLSATCHRSARHSIEVIPTSLQICTCTKLYFFERSGFMNKF